LDPLYSLPVRADLRARRLNLGEDGARFASAAGLAAAAGVSGTPNLLAAEKKKRPSVGARIKAQPKLAAALAGVICLLVVIPQISMLGYYKNESLMKSRKVKEARAEIKRRQASQLEFAEKEKALLERKAELEDKLALFRVAGKDRRSFSRTLARLASVMPDEIWVTKLSYVEKKLVLVASTAKNEAMIKFLEDLRKPDDFSDVVFNYTKRDPKSSVFSFEVMMGVK
jgi:Tfp pilus assembly protein PilN